MNACDYYQCTLIMRDDCDALRGLTVVYSMLKLTKFRIHKVKASGAHSELHAHSYRQSSLSMLHT